MNPQNQQKREIKFSSQKNGRLLVVNSEAAMSIEDFVSKKTGKKFSAKLVWNKSKNQIEFDFSK